MTPEHDIWKEGTRIEIATTLITISVSHNHAKLIWDAKLRLYKIEDLGSKFGTLVKEHPLPPGTQVFLQNRDTVILGRRGIGFQIIYK